MLWNNKKYIVIIIVILLGFYGIKLNTAKIQAKQNDFEDSMIKESEIFKNSEEIGALKEEITIKDLPIAPAMKKIIEKGKLTVGMYYEDKPPFFMRDKNGELYGVDVKIAKDIARCLHVDAEFNRQAQSYQELFEMVAKGEVDVVISQFSRTFERSKYIRYSQPYANFRQALLVNKVEAAKHDIEDYPMHYLRKARVKIGVEAGTSYVEFAKTLFENAEIKTYKAWPDVADALIKGEIVAAIYDENEVTKIIRQRPDMVLYTSAYVLKDQKDAIAIAVPWESTHLLSWINTYLETYDVKKDVKTLIKEYPEIYEKNPDL